MVMRREYNQRYLTEEYLRDEASPGQLYGHTIDGLVSVIKFEKPVLSSGSNAVLVIGALIGDDLSDAVQEHLKNEAAKTDIRNIGELDEFKKLGNLRTHIVRGYLDDEFGIPISNNAFDETQQKADTVQGKIVHSESEVYLVQFRNSEQRGTNPIYFKLGIALPDDNPERYLFHREHLSWCRIVKNIKTFLAKNNPQMKFVPGTLWENKLIRDNIERDKMIENN